MIYYKIIIAASVISSVSAHKIEPVCFSISDPQTDVDSTVYLFAHGLAATHRQANLLFANLATNSISSPSYNKYWIVKNPLVVFDFPDAKSDNEFNWHRKMVNLGQEVDIQTLRDAYSYTATTYENRAIVMAGVSRGASTIINYVALDKPEKVKALVLESPFDTLANVICHLLKQYHLKWIPFSYTLAMKYMSATFPLLNLSGIVPHDVVHNIPHTIPILLIHSKKDKTIPIASSRSLYAKLVEAGHPAVHLLEIATGEHARIICGPEADLYHNVVQAFYKFYNLPHQEEAARKGQAMFNYCQPSCYDINNKLKTKRSFIEHTPSDALLYSIDIPLQE